MIEPGTKKIFRATKHCFTKDFITVVGNLEGSYVAMRAPAKNPEFSTNIAPSNPYLSEQKNEIIDEELKRDWVRFLSQETRTILVGPAVTLGRTEAVIKKIKNPLRTFTQYREEANKALAHKIELMSAIDQYSLAGLASYKFRNTSRN